MWRIAGSGAWISSSPPTVGCCAAAGGRLVDQRMRSVGGRFQRLGRRLPKRFAAPRARSGPWSPSRNDPLLTWSPFNPCWRSCATCRFEPQLLPEPPATTAGRTDLAPHAASRWPRVGRTQPWYGCLRETACDPGILAKRMNASDKLSRVRLRTGTHLAQTLENSLGPCRLRSQTLAWARLHAAEQRLVERSLPPLDSNVAISPIR